MIKNLTFGAEARKQLRAGIDKIANAVKLTLGAKGRNVAITKYGAIPHNTKDGVTVVKSIMLKDPAENMGALMVKDVAQKTVEVAGDGTTTATVLFQSIVGKIDEALEAEDAPLEIKDGIETAVRDVVGELKSRSVNITDENFSVINDIAAISANNDSVIGSLIYDAYEKVGIDGIVTAENSNSNENSLLTVDGLLIDRGYINVGFVTNKSKMSAEMDNPVVVIVNKTIVYTQDILKLVQDAVKVNKPLLIIAEDVIGEAMSFLLMNLKQGGIPKGVCVIKAPSFGEERNLFLDDIATVTGATIISDDAGILLKDASLVHFGKAEKITVDKHRTIIAKGGGDFEAINLRISELKDMISSDGITDFERDFAKRRLAKIKNGIAVIKIGGFTETEVVEKRDRVDDALCAVRSAIDEGFVAGGGATLTKISAKLRSKKFEHLSFGFSLGYNVVLDSINEPYNQILKNGGVDPSKHDVSMLLEGEGYDIKNKKYSDLLKVGIIDPIKVIRVALENAASVGCLYLTTECVISEDLESIN
jgi:chaperonin GroEL